MKIFFSFLFFFFSLFSFSQDEGLIKNQKPSNGKLVNDDVQKKAPIDQYRIITLQKDTTFVDTTLTIKKEYDYNYLRKDNFGLMPFPNEGQTFNVLDFGLTKFTPYPEFGFTAKHSGYLQVNDINYYSVATPLTELYFKTVMEQGQNVDAFVTLNTSERFNFSIAYKGLRSLGKYINQLSSSGNFRFTASYFTKSKRYLVNFHYTGQDLLNGENGGLTTISDFESEDPNFDNRARLQVFFKDAKSFLKGKRFFVDHLFRINKNDAENNLFITHQLNYENKFFEYNQATIASAIGTANESVQRFGDAYLNSNINDQTHYNKMYNKVGAVYENKTLGKFQFFVEDFRDNYYYNKVLILDTDLVPSKLSNKVQAVGGQYEYRKNNWNAKLQYSNAISKQSFTNIDGTLAYKLNDKNKFTFQYQNISKLPNDNYNLHQSSYVNYNWGNNFNNEKINNIIVNAATQWANASLQLTTLDDHLYFSDDATLANTQLVSPKQYGKTISYLSLKASKEIKYRKWALDNTILYQKTAQDDAILNVPELTLRHTIYYSNYFFKRALFLQSGVTLNYFSKYYANDYNPVLGEFFVQNNKEIGNFPMLDLFVNARIRQTRIYLKAEHFNSSFTGNNFYSAPNTPYHDFMIRFGLVWNFFQ